MKKTFCPICDKIQQCDKVLANVKQKKATYDLVFCNICHMCLQYPAISYENIQEYYSSGYNLSNYDNDLDATFQTMKGISEVRFNFIYQNIGGIPNSYLEMGPGVGTLMSIFKQNGSDVVGIEADSIAAQWMQDVKKIKYS